MASAGQFKKPEGGEVNLKRKFGDSQGSKHARKDKAKKQAPIDLGSFVQKLRTRDVDIVPDFKWFTKTAKNFEKNMQGLDVVKELLQMIDCDFTLLTDYIKMLGIDDRIELFTVIDAIFGRFSQADGLGSLQQKCIIQAQKMLTNLSEIFLSMLSVDGNVDLMKPLLRMFTSMVMVGPEMADSFVQAMDLQFFNNLWYKIKVRSEVSVRTCAQYLLIALLCVSNRPTLYRLLGQTQIFPWAFAGLVHDRCHVICSFLQTFYERVIENTAVSKTQKIGVLNKVTLTPVMDLLVWKGQLEWRGKEWNRIYLFNRKNKSKDIMSAMKGNELVVASPAEQQKVRNWAAKFLGSLFFSSKEGIAFRDPKLGLGERNCNTLVTQVVSSSPQVFSEPESADFMADLFIALPDQLKYIVTARYYNFNTPKMSKSHCIFYNVLAKVVSKQDFNVIFSRLNPSTPDRFVDIIKHFCLLSFVPKTFDGYNLTSTYCVIRFMDGMLQKLVEVMQLLDKDTRRVLVPILKDVMPSPELVTGLLSVESSAEDLRRLNEYTGGDIGDYALRVLSALSHLASPNLGYITSNLSWNLLSEVDALLGDRISMVKKVNVYLKLINMIFSYVPNFEEQLVKEKMKPLRSLFTLLAECQADGPTQADLVNHTIDILKKFPMLGKFGNELELWLSTILSTDDPETNMMYAMALCDALLDVVSNRNAYESEIFRLTNDSASVHGAKQVYFSPIAVPIVKLDPVRWPVFTAVLREILHSQVDYVPFQKFLLQRKTQLDFSLRAYIDFLDKGRHPIVKQEEPNVDVYSSENAMIIENALMSSLSGGHPKSLERCLVKIRYDGESGAVNFTLADQLLFMMRWCHIKEKKDFARPVAASLCLMAEYCDGQTFEKLIAFLSCEIVKHNFCKPDQPEITELVLSIIHRAIDNKIKIGMNINNLKDKAMKAVFNKKLKVERFIHAYEEIALAGDFCQIIEFACGQKSEDFGGLCALLKILCDKTCVRLTRSTVQYLCVASLKDSNLCSQFSQFLDCHSNHCLAVDSSVFIKLLNSASPLALKVFRPTNDFVTALDSCVTDINDPKFAMDLLVVLSTEFYECSGREIAATVLRILHKALPTFISGPSETIGDVANFCSNLETVFQYLEHVVSIFEKDYVKLLKGVHVHVDIDPSVVHLMLCNQSFGKVQYNDDLLITLLKCFMKLAPDNESIVLQLNRSFHVLEKVEETAWSCQWLQNNWSKIVKSVLKKAITADGCSLRLLQVICSNVYRRASIVNEVTITDIVDMIYGHSKFLKVLIGEDSLLKQRLIELLICLVELDSQSCKSSHIPMLLCGYNASLSKSDQFIFHLLTLYEASNANMTMFQPLVWGEAASAFYCVDKGPQGVQVMKETTMSHVMALISETKLQNTIDRFPHDDMLLDPAHVFDMDNGADVYDVRFMLMSIYHLLWDMTEVQTIRLVEDGIPLLALVALTAKCEDLRTLGYTLLNRIYRKMERVSDHPLILYLMAILDSLRNSLGAKGPQRLTCVVAGYLIRSCQLVISSPQHPLYNMVMRSSIARPAFDLERLPLLLKLYAAPSVHSKEKRLWINNIFENFAKSKKDFGLITDKGILESMMMFSLSSTCKEDELLSVISTMKAWIKTENFNRFNTFTMWLSELMTQFQEDNQTVNSEVAELLFVLTHSLQKHTLREGEAFLLDEIGLLHVQFTKYLEKCDIGIKIKFIKSLYEVLKRLPSERSGTLIYESTVRSLHRWYLQMSPDEVQQVATPMSGVLLTWSPSVSPWTEEEDHCDLWLVIVELMFCKLQADPPTDITKSEWRICQMEMFHRWLSDHPELILRILKTKTIHKIYKALSRCVDSAPLLVIEVFDMISKHRSQNIRNNAVFADKDDDETRARHYVCVLGEAWLESSGEYEDESEMA